MKDVANKYLFPLILSALSVFAPIKGMIITVFISIIVDLITGILAAKKRGEKITSAALRRSVSKLLIYETALLVSFLVETYLLSDSIPITKLVGGILGSVEMLSIYENLNVVSGNNLFGRLISLLGSHNDKKDAPVDDAPKE